MHNKLPRRFLGYTAAPGQPINKANPPKGGSAMVMPKHPSKIPPLPPETTQD